LHAASSYGHIDIIQFLLDQGADIDIADNDGDTPLYTVESIPIARYLVEHGATIDRLNLEGVSVRLSRVDVRSFDPS
jgi:ankyrin repeat protein